MVPKTIMHMIVSDVSIRFMRILWHLIWISSRIFVYLEKGIISIQLCFSLKRSQKAANCMDYYMLLEIP